MANNTYNPENDLNLDANLSSDDTYAPENDLALKQDLVSVPQLSTLAATTTETGGESVLSGTTTISTQPTVATESGGISALLGGTTTMATSPATMTATGGQILFATDRLKQSAATATYTGGTSNLTTGLLLNNAASYTATGGTSGLLDTQVGTQTASYTASGGSSGLSVPPLNISGASASYSGGTSAFQGLLGTGGEITVLIDGNRIDTYTNIEVEKRLNEVDTFGFDAFITDSNDRSLIQEGNDVKIIENYNTLLFKGRLTEVEYKSDFRAKCEGDGMSTILLNRKTDRDNYNNTAGDDIVKDVVPSSVMDYGQIDAAPSVSVRFDHDNLARAVAGVANATGYDWYVDQKESDDYDVDYLYFVDEAGDGTSQKTFEIGDDAQLVERDKDEGFIANDITLLGRGDGINQLESRVFAATTKFTDTSQVIDEAETGSFTVDDTSQLGSTGDNLIVRVGTEVMNVDITDSTTLSINSRGANDYDGNSTEQIKHYDNIRVWLRENVTQGIGPFKPTSKSAAEDGSSVEVHGVKQERSTDKTIVDKSTLEKTVDLELKNRFEDIFRIKVDPTDPRVTEELELGDTVDVKDITAMDVDDSFRIVGMDVMRASAEEGTTLHLANRPRRLTERLSDMERDRNTLNAHMQGATNFNGESFGDNCDNSHPVSNKIYVPDDVVAVNKFQLTFTRESFRGYVQNSAHSHDVTIPDHDHFVDLSNTSSDGGGGGSVVDDSANILSTGQTIDSGVGTWNKVGSEINPDDSDTSGMDVWITFIQDFVGSTTGNDYIRVRLTNNDTGDHFPSAAGVRAYISEDQKDEDQARAHVQIHVPQNTNFSEYDIEAETSDTTEDWDVAYNWAAYAEHTHDLGITETTTDSGGTTETTTSSGSPNYGVFEPSSEPDIDVNVKVDGNTVTTINNVSVGQEVSTPIDLKGSLSEPIAGDYHEVTLEPVDIGGGNGGRSRLSADIFQKVFIESTL